jgi:hypothetical protein
MIVVNICICLVAAQALFLIGVDKTDPATGCGVFVLFMAYFFLASLMVRFPLGISFP